MTLKLTSPGRMVPRYMTALFFGVPGTRKSTLANTAPRPVLPIALDTGYGRSKWAHDALTPNEISKWEDLIAAVTPETKHTCLLYTSPSPRDRQKSRMPSSA